ncbi:MAG: ATP-dependent zinc metalloprotease FtsH [bacterium]
MPKYLKTILFFALIIVLLGAYLAKAPKTVEKLTTSEWLTRLDAGQIRNVDIEGTKLSGKLNGGKPDSYETYWVNDHNTLITTLMATKKKFPLATGDGKPIFEFNVKQNKISDSVIWNVLSMILMAALFIGFWMFIMRQAQSGGSQAMSFGRSKAKRMTDQSIRVTFDDVAGVEEAKQELVEIVDFLKNPKKYSALGARIPKGVLLLGPPGSGKTLLARAVAGEAGVPFFHISGSDFVEMFVGVGASRVRDLFEQAKAHKPCIVFIDEIDAVGRQRFAGFGGGHDEREQTLNQLLVEMDGFDPNSGIILIAATNRPDVLDPALLRPGRFDRQIMVDLADCKGRQAILEVHIKGKPAAQDVNLEVLARRTPGFSGADLANLLNEAALLAARGNKTRIEMKDMEAAIDRVIAGPERKSRIISETEKKIIAFHEVGHALLAELLPKADPLHKVSILPRGRALGYTLNLPEEDRYLTSRSEMLEDITVLLGGRASEELNFGEITTGAHNDLERASAIARAMITQYGMSDAIGPRVLGKRQSQVFLGRDIMEDRDYSENTAELIDAEVHRIIETSYNKAKELLSENSEVASNIVKVLLVKESLSRDEVTAIMRGEMPELESDAVEVKIEDVAPTEETTI